MGTSLNAKSKTVTNTNETKKPTHQLVISLDFGDGDAVGYGRIGLFANNAQHSETIENADNAEFFEFLQSVMKFQVVPYDEQPSAKLSIAEKMKLAQKK